MEPMNELDDDDVVVLTLDDGSELECQIVAIYPVDGKQYIALLPSDAGEDADVFIYGYEEDEDGEPRLINIEDDDEFEAASDGFDELLDEEEFAALADEDEE